RKPIPARATASGRSRIARIRYNCRSMIASLPPVHPVARNRKPGEGLPPPALRVPALRLSKIRRRRHPRSEAAAPGVNDFVASRLEAIEAVSDGKQLFLWKFGPSGPRREKIRLLAVFFAVKD